MDQHNVCASSEGGRELQELYTRLRDVGGSGLAQGQTHCCHVLSNNHSLLWAFRKILTTFPQGLLRRRTVPVPALRTAEEITL